jgi:flavin reductase (DIM6/NTAB) family NADH-FMN oxidoreductase RutF
MSRSDQAHDGAEVDSSSFKALMSTFPSGVTVVTAADGLDSPFGLTCSSMCSVSVDPPLLLVCIWSGSRTLSAIRRGGVFGVNFLHTGGREAAELFSSSVPDRFRHIAWQRTMRSALPYLPAHAHAVAECQVRADVPGGDHSVLIGEVMSIATLAGTPPLLHCQRQYVEWPDLPVGSAGDHVDTRRLR